LANWKINCMEDSYPGLWHTWFREQIVAVGWPPPEFGLHTQKEKRDWSVARRYLLQMSRDDKVIVQAKELARRPDRHGARQANRRWGMESERSQAGR
jgi:hypothetical protein